MQIGNYLFSFRTKHGYGFTVTDLDDNEDVTIQFLVGVFIIGFISIPFICK